MPPSRAKAPLRRASHRLAAALCGLALLQLGCSASLDQPNIIYILVDDLGYGEVGAYGQSLIRTPNIDRLAENGMRFDQHYAGSPICAASRASLMTGKHTGHGVIRDNSNVEDGGYLPWRPEGQRPLPDAELTIAEILQDQGYSTGFFGKWGLGGPKSEGVPRKQGFGQFYGHLGQLRAHNHYSPHVHRNELRIALPGNSFMWPHRTISEPLPSDQDYYDRFMQETYGPDAILDEALDFIRAHDSRRFFLTYATPLPHVALQVPLDSLAEYEGLWDVEPYLGDRGYLPHPHPRAAYAAMITRMDEGIGQIIDLVEELGLQEQTIIIFASDNGPTGLGGVELDFFDSTGGLRGAKAFLYEGGIRVPMIVSWPGTIEPNTTTAHISALWDVLPTLADLVGAAIPPDIDGISFLPTLLGQQSEQEEHDSLYWEFHDGHSGTQAVRQSNWKALRKNIRTLPEPPVELYDLANDVAETTDLAAVYPDIAQQMLDLMQSSRTPSEFPEWNFLPEWEEGEEEPESIPQLSAGSRIRRYGVRSFAEQAPESD